MVRSCSTRTFSAGDGLRHRAGDSGSRSGGGAGAGRSSSSPKKVLPTRLRYGLYVGIAWRSTCAGWPPSPRFAHGPTPSPRRRSCLSQRRCGGSASATARPVAVWTVAILSILFTVYTRCIRRSRRYVRSSSTSLIFCPSPLLFCLAAHRTRMGPWTLGPLCRRSSAVRPEAAPA